MHAITAIFRAVNDYMNGRLKSRNVHSEIVFSFNPANNVCCTLQYRPNSKRKLISLDC